MAFAQIAIAQHNTVHLNHGFEVAGAQHHSDAHHEHDDKNLPSKHQCPECLLVKSLQTAFYADSAINISFTAPHQAFLARETFLLIQFKTSAYNSRAPPTVLI